MSDDDMEGEATREGAIHCGGEAAKRRRERRWAARPRARSAARSAPKNGAAARAASNSPLSMPGVRTTTAIQSDYGFEYSDEEQEEEDVDIENQYYNSKGEEG